MKNKINEEIDEVSYCACGNELKTELEQETGICIECS